MSTPRTHLSLEERVYAASKAAFSAVIKAHPDQNFYAFGLFTDDSLQFLHAVANTEEALTETVRRYKKEVDPQFGCTSTHAGMRWAYGDWGFFPEIADEHFIEINDIVRANFDLPSEQFAAAVEPMWLAVLTGLKRLEQEHFFGEGHTRSKITLLVVGDLPPEFVESWVRELNPSDVVERYVSWDADAPDSPGGSQQ
ncbi:uncharacterized protein DUF4303 [Roseimicrobium gellanilyticum]|uniref:Uncharacterized protein DUF4303 n=1 Tax=Roseimicrobium gellanilyticum TaxID=748857 RepID=A0A366HIJ1_9BACT|nr:DUF4303 domain-containing protein [Roseimicrobium gellanilyticum]RBP42482.1 uncharacterized protein DUF4303 [Roseimicrobium gellanilyticum]